MRRSDGTFLTSMGRPKGTRNRLQRSFLWALAKDFEEHGADAIRICRVEEPSRYVQIVASLMPKELDIESRVASDLDDEQLDALIEEMRAQLLAKNTEKPMLIEAKLAEKIA
jgi:hypothetical protein